MHVLRNVWFLTLSTCVEGIRHRALWTIVFLAILLIMTNLVFTTLFTWDLGKVSVEFGLSAVAFTGLLLVFFLGLKILSDDLERGRIFMLISRPVSTGQYLTGKFLGLVLVLSCSTLILGAAAIASMHFVIFKYSAYVPQNFSWVTYAMALGCQWMSLVIVLAVSVFCFSFASHPFIALLLAVSSYLVGQNMELLRKIVLDNTQVGLLSGKENLVIVISWIFPNLSLFDKKYVAAYGMSFSFQEFLFLFFYAMSYSCLMIYISNILFKRKEMV